MKMQEVRKMAKKYKINSFGKSKINLIQEIQRAEGNFDCFGKSNGFCDQYACCFRSSCLDGYKTKPRKSPRRPTPASRDGPMTKTAYMKMVRELAKRSERDMIKAAEGLWNSGAIDPSAYSRDDYILPKMFMCAYAGRLKRMWSPPYHNKKAQSEIRNFEHFI